MDFSTPFPAGSSSRDDGQSERGPLRKDRVERDVHLIHGIEQLLSVL